MKISHRKLPRVWLAVVLAFTVVSGAGFTYLWVNSGGRIPLLTSAGYRVSFPVSDTDNLVYFSDVRMAGVQVGKVVRIDNPPAAGSGPATMTVELDEEVAPLHAGATVRVGAKTLVEESYVAVTDGAGPELPSGSQLAARAVTPSVQLDQVLGSLDPAAREDLGSSIRRLGDATRDRGGDIGAAMTGLGGIGREGRTAVDAIAAQSADLERLSANTRVLLDALDTQDGDIARLVSSGSQLAGAGADGGADIEAAMRETPSVLSATGTASDRLTELAGALDPVARNLDEASPLLTAALNELPGTTADLRATLPALDGTLDAAPDTLARVPTFGSDVRDLVPPARVTLADVNPALAYIEPYGRDIAAFFTNFGAQASRGNADGKWGRIMMQASEQSVRSFPVPTNVGPLDRSNAYPEPGEASHPGRPFDGPYPRIERDGG